MAHAQLVRTIARKLAEVLSRRRLAEELFANGLVGCLKGIRRFATRGSTSLWHGKSYVGRSARNEMNDWLLQEFPNVQYGVTIQRAQFDYDGELHPKLGKVVPTNREDCWDQLTDEQAREILLSICTEPNDKWILHQKELGLLSEDEIGKKVGMTRRQVQYALLRLYRTAECRFGLPHLPATKRKSRREPSVDRAAA
jgi:DNA-directed RNA polymerase specialized sigma24 family protein